MKRPSFSWRFVVVPIVGALLAGAALVAVWQQQYITDWLTVNQYPPSAETIQLAEASYLNEHGAFLFYASRPEVESTQRFNEHCGQHERGSAILGCFVNDRIYLYKVNEQELSGINEVTAAHEMLHAAYQRLSNSEQKRIDELLEREIERQRHNTIFQERMKVYSHLPEVDKLNEYHSVIGTEIDEISDELEQYYSTYFTDRSQVLVMHRHYSEKFTTLQQEADTLSKELEQRADAINNRATAYKRDSARYNEKVSKFNANAQSGALSQRQFTTERTALTVERDRLNQTANEINQSITAYEQDRKKLDGLALHLTELNQSIDSSVAPPARI
ncbi:MAG TPA: hypothetical protein PKD19_00785 [Candidatus Saccharibacteria bacterium]|nr:hypothetical protein [Candidatus Saccharibacteria bacterium]HMR38231.1 hypothetical protein [Candidatus Saccharibacteria bacterium]